MIGFCLGYISFYLCRSLFTKFFREKFLEVFAECSTFFVISGGVIFGQSLFNINFVFSLDSLSYLVGTFRIIDAFVSFKRLFNLPRNSTFSLR